MGPTLGLSKPNKNSELSDSLDTDAANPKIAATEESTDFHLKYTSLPDSCIQLFESRVPDTNTDSLSQTIASNDIQ